jgi:hypothetical protein
MARLSKPERDARQAGSVAEEYHLTKEAAFEAPTLEKLYWSGPNKPRGEIAMCSYREPRAVLEKKKSEGI